MENYWKCSCGKTDNTGNFCMACGTARPAASDVWSCSCGKTDNTGNFCMACGAPKSGNAQNSAFGATNTESEKSKTSGVHGAAKHIYSIADFFTRLFCGKKHIETFHAERGVYYHKEVNDEFKKWVHSPFMIALASMLSVMSIWSLIDAIMALTGEAIAFELITSLIGIEVFPLLRVLDVLLTLAPIILFVALCVGMWTMILSSYVCKQIIDIKGLDLICRCVGLWKYFGLLGFRILFVVFGITALICLFSGAGFIIFMLLFMLLVPYGIYRLYKAFYEYIEGLVNDIRRRIWDPNSYYAKTESVGVISFIVAAMYILPVLGRYGLVTELEDLMGDLVESELIWNFVDFATTGLGGSIIMFFVFALLGIVAFTYIGTQRRMTEQFVRTGGRKSFY